MVIYIFTKQLINFIDLAIMIKSIKLIILSIFDNWYLIKCVLCIEFV